MKDMLWAINIAIEGREHLLFKWEGDYGAEYPIDIRVSRRKEIGKEIAKLQGMKAEIKCK